MRTSESLTGTRWRKPGGNLTVTAILVKALSRALLEFPKFNSSIHMGSRTIVYKKYVNIGVAVDTERGASRSGDKGRGQKGHNSDIG